MQISVVNDVTIYNLTGNKRFTTWTRSTMRQLRSSAEFRERVTLLQGLLFPNIGETVRVSSDGNWLVTTGIYPPQTRILDLQNMTTKVTRYLDDRAVDALPLTPDWVKQAYLLENRTLVFHGRQGTVASVRTPRAGRMLRLEPGTAELLVGGDAPELWRFSLEFGSWMSPWPIVGNEVTAMAVCPLTGLVLVGSDAGVITAINSNTGDRLGVFDVSSALLQQPGITADDQYQISTATQITSIACSNDGLNFVVGTGAGFVALFDVRSPLPLHTFQLPYGEPVISVDFVGRELLLAADSHACRFYNRETGAFYTAIEPTNTIREVTLIPNSGMLFIPCESEQINIFYLPAVGPAPKWCPFVDSLVVEAENKRAEGEVVYDGYVFVTEEEYNKAGMQRWAGTANDGSVKPMLHGFYVRTDVWRKAMLTRTPAEAGAGAGEEHDDRILVRRARPGAAEKAARHAEELAQAQEEDEEDEAGDRFDELFGDAESFQEAEELPEGVEFEEYSTSDEEGEGEYEYEAGSGSEAGSEQASWEDLSE